MGKKVTLKHIADNLGISVSAVSFAINNRPGIADELRQQVIQTCEQMGYDLGRLDRKRNTVGEIGFLVRSEELENRESPYGMMLIEAQRVAEAHGYHLIPNGMHGDDVAALKLPRCLERPISGLILDEGFDMEYLQFLMERKLPMVQMADRRLHPLINVVDADNQMGGEIAVEYLRERGHRRIGLIAGLPERHSMLTRRAGYLLGLEHSNLALDHEIMVTNIDDNLPQSAYAATRQIMQRQQTPPDAFFCVSDPYATGCMRALQDLGLSIPDDISVIGFDNHSYAEHLSPPLTTIELPILDIAKVAVHRLIDLINLHEKQLPDVIGKFLIPVRMIERASVADRHRMSARVRRRALAH
jgi:LacI family transcriptional regulator